MINDRNAWSSFDLQHYETNNQLKLEMYKKLFAIDFVHKVITNSTKLVSDVILLKKRSFSRTNIWVNSTILPDTFGLYVIVEYIFC